MYNGYKKSVCGQCGIYSDGHHQAEEHVTCLACGKSMTISNSHGHWHRSWFQ